MRILRNSYVILLTGILACNVSFAQDAETPPVIIDYFYEPGCPDCLKVKNQIMPELEMRFEGFYQLNKHDMGQKTNVIKLAAYQEKLGNFENKPVSMIVDYQHVFNGFSAIEKSLYDRIDECVAERMEPGWKSPEAITIPQEGQDGLKLISDQMKQFTAVAVAIAGITDGINPCAIATLVFFMSLLTVSKVQGSGLLFMGISFCLASFLTYTAIGFGLLRALHLLDGFEDIRTVVEWGMIGLLAVFAFLSFRDAFKYKTSENPDDVSLQLPHGIKMKIHSIIRQGVRAKSLILGGFVVGILVTALESVCTGQVYIPTLVLMIKAGETKATAWSYLLLYNLMFIVPLVLIFVLTYLGLKTETLLEWSRKNVVFSKIILGLFFIAMAVLIWVM